jgi:hypothetical protein
MQVGCQTTGLGCCLSAAMKEVRCDRWRDSSHVEKLMLMLAALLTCPVLASTCINASNMSYKTDSRPSQSDRHAVGYAHAYSTCGLQWMYSSIECKVPPCLTKHAVVCMLQQAQHHRQPPQAPVRKSARTHSTSAWHLLPQTSAHVRSH